MTGYVYAMVSGDKVKFGWSMKPQLRVSKVRSDTPSQVSLVGYVAGTREQESEIHSLLKPWHVFGEWFFLSDPVRKVVALFDGLGVDDPILIMSNCHPLRRYRLENKITLCSLGDAIGVRQSFISKIELRQAQPSLKTISKLVELTNGAVTPNDFMPSPPWKEETAA